MELPPAGLTWAEYVDRWVTDCGGWLPLADQLIHRATGAVDVPLDPQTVERGLRRLARRHHQAGGQYGRWLVRFFGFTSPIEQRVRWLGNHHSRFADLPSSIRLELLTLWDRPPVAESPLVAWIHLGIASAHHAQGDRAAATHWLGLADRQRHTAGAGADVEAELLRAQLDLDDGAHGAARDRHAWIAERLRAAPLPSVHAACYLARLHDQRARLEPDHAARRAIYAAIPDVDVAYVRHLRSVGLAYCTWKLGDVAEAARLAQQAVDAAGDGGLVRLRVSGLNLLSRVLPTDEAARVNARAQRMAEALQDEELMRRVRQSAPT